MKYLLLCLMGCLLFTVACDKLVKNGDQTEYEKPMCQDIITYLRVTGQNTQVATQRECEAVVESLNKCDTVTHRKQASLIAACIKGLYDDRAQDKRTLLQDMGTCSPQYTEAWYCLCETGVTLMTPRNDKPSYVMCGPQPTT